MYFDMRRRHLNLNARLNIFNRDRDIRLGLVRERIDRFNNVRNRWNAGTYSRNLRLNYQSALVQQRVIDREKAPPGRIFWRSSNDRAFVQRYVSNMRKQDMIRKQSADLGINLNFDDLIPREGVNDSPNLDVHFDLDVNPNIEVGSVDNPIVVRSPRRNRFRIRRNVMRDEVNDYNSELNFDAPMSPNPNEDAVPEVIVNQLQQQYVGNAPPVVNFVPGLPGGPPPPPPPPGYNRVKGVFCNLVKRINYKRKKKGLHPVREAAGFWWLVVCRRNKKGKIYRRDHYFRGQAIKQ
jgi:hypothetical protein